MLDRRTVGRAIPLAAATALLASCSKAMSGPAVEPSPVVDRSLKLAYLALEASLIALGFVPQVPPAVVQLAQGVLNQLRKAYVAYTADPSETLRDQLQAAVTAGLAFMGEQGRDTTQHALKLKGARPKVK